MRAEVVAIGDELTSGVRLDTNSQWLSQRLEEMGLRVAFHTTVGDELADIVSTLKTALARVQVVILSGGLGPTADDLTRQALAHVVDRPLIVRQEVLQHIRALFARRGREMPERNITQAEFPEGSTVIANPHGTAPGIRIDVPAEGERSGTHLFALPGVPAELKQMWTGTVQPQLIEMLGDQRQIICHRTIRCFGTGESDVERRLPDLVRHGRDPSVGITASQATISLRVTARGTSPEVCHERMEPTIATIYDCLGTLVYGEQDDTLQQVVARLLQQRQLHLATADWGTEGLTAHWLASTRTRFLKGAVAVGDRSGLSDILHFGEAQLLLENADLAAEMAAHVRDQFQSDLGLAVGPRPDASSTAGSGEEPSRIYFALATPHTVIHSSSVFTSHPSIRQQRAAKEALNLARLWLLEH